MSKKSFHFPGITILIPEQKSKKKLVAINKGIEFPEKIPNKTDQFTVIRIIGNIVLYDQDDLKHKAPLEEFDPPIEIRVGYNNLDISESKGALKNLKLAYWDQKNWVIINASDHDYQIFPPTTGQVAEAKIKTWAGDPPLAWGR